MKTYKRKPSRFEKLKRILPAVKASTFWILVITIFGTVGVQISSMANQMYQHEKGYSMAAKETPVQRPRVLIARNN